ncbi:MAG TPA: endonuclease domain-containing protein [Allosphingosinicella sp.]|nr:endonuclease domain-containing protein [Allosphingosinicella sp.]
MRREPTEPEKRLWRHLSNSQLGGFKFRRQAAIPPFIVDFFCPAKGLIVEVDGDTHEAGADARRDVVLANRGFPTIRFTNGDVMTNMDGVLTTILHALGNRPDRQWNSPHSPTPTPPLKGRGL